MAADVLDELGLSLLLGVFWRVDLTRDFIPLLAASDASTSFGFGVCVAPFPREHLCAIARWSEKQGAYVLLDGSDKESGRSRLGEPLQLDVCMADFKDVLCVRCRYPAHINVLESYAFLLWLKWLLRSRQNHSRRAVVLIDSAVVVGAAAKGRSSSCLRHSLRKVAALELAGNLQIYVVLVPSLHNPADAPSRGVKPGKRSRQTPDGLNSLQR
jgi:hypothetical protein